MAYPKELYEIVKQQYSTHLFDAQNERETRKNELYRIVPRLSEIEKELKKVGLNLVSEAFDAKDAAESLKKMQDKSLALQMERCELLTQNGYPQDYLEIKYKCPLCKDTGYGNDGYCSCFKKKLAEEAYKRANLPIMMDTQSFDTFRIDVYPEEAREEMDSILRVCKNFAQTFQSESGKNLYLYGGTGLGKTFMSSCIAKEVLNGGASVFYQPAYRIFRIFEEYKFNQENKAINKAQMDTIMNTDLLIIDDLGTEMVTAFTAEVLFDLINTRMNTKKSTVISTNLDFPDLETIYSPRISSRIIGGYITLEFQGRDIRMQD